MCVSILLERYNWTDELLRAMLDSPLAKRSRRSAPRSSQQTGGEMSQQFAAEASLPADLRPVYNALVRDYTQAAKARGDLRMKNFEILADLVRAGWRKQQGEPRGEPR
jgi:hypothetical protein